MKWLALLAGEVHALKDRSERAELRDRLAEAHERLQLGHAARGRWPPGPGRGVRAAHLPTKSSPPYPRLHLQVLSGFALVGTDRPVACPAPAARAALSVALRHF